MRQTTQKIRERLGSFLVKIGERVMTKPREWPNSAIEARDKAAEAAQRGVRTLQPIMDGSEMTEAEKTRRTGLAYGLFHLIARILEGHGAQTKP